MRDCVCSSEIASIIRNSVSYTCNIYPKHCFAPLYLEHREKRQVQQYLFIYLFKHILQAQRALSKGGLDFTMKSQANS